jgi:DHA1 family bicyclomycin/chloramphenicol resistance-like MFS transporter
MLPLHQRLPRGLFLGFLIVLNMFVPLSMDLYLPALPDMSRQLGGSSEAMNLTLTGFFLVYALGALIMGPLSDKHGRRPVLLAMVVLYTLGSVACAFAPNLAVLIFTRCLQGLAAGGISTVVMAVIKDSFGGTARSKALAWTQTLGALAPMVAPSIGSAILFYADWRGIFGLLALVGLVALGLTLAYSETHRAENRFEGSVWGAMAQLGKVVTNGRAMAPLLIFAVAAVPFLGYISASSYIYIDQFGLDRAQFALFFAANALCTMASPVLYAQWGVKLDKGAFSIGALALGLLAGVLLITAGNLGPWFFFGFFAVYAMVSTGLRPFVTNLVFDQHDGDNGALASVMGIANNLLGSLGMVLASLSAANRVGLLGTIITASGALALVAWIVLLRSNHRPKGLEKRT